MRSYVEHLSIWWNALIHPETAGRLVLADSRPTLFDLRLTVAVTLVYAFYGASMGLYKGPIPGLISAVKLPFLFAMTFAICLPGLYVANCLAGPRLTLVHCVRLLLISGSVNAVALGSYAPISFFLTLTTSSDGYQFLVLMHFFVFTVAGLSGAMVLVLIFRSTAERLGRRFDLSFSIGWGVLYGFVGAQVTWTLRPWIGSAAEYTFFRAQNGSFIEAIWALLT